MPPRSETQVAAYKWALLWQAFPLPSIHSAQSAQQPISPSCVRAIAEQGWHGHTSPSAQQQWELLPDSHHTPDQQWLQQDLPSCLNPDWDHQQHSRGRDLVPCSRCREDPCPWQWQTVALCMVAAVPSSASICLCSCWAVLGEGSHCFLILRHQTAKLQDCKHHKKEAFF